MTTRWIFALALCALAAVPQAATAQSKLKLFGALAYVAPLHDNDVTFAGVTDAVKASAEFGYDVGFEFRPASLIGIEVDYLYAKQDIDGEAAGTLGTTTFQPICATVNFHLPIPAMDLYGGPTVAYVNWGDLELESGADQEIDPNVAFGLSATGEIGIVPKLSLLAGLRWLNVRVESEGSDDLKVHPLFARLGLALHL